MYIYICRVFGEKMIDVLFTDEKKLNLEILIVSVTFGTT